MRRNSKVNPKLSKIVARQNYRDRQIDKWWKWSWQQRGRIKYTPDFICPDYTFIIECKGRANESFPIRWKLFKKYVITRFPNTVLFKPQNQKECDETVRLILSYLN